jgi:hypothetical protein
MVPDWAEAPDTTIALWKHLCHLKMVVRAESFWYLMTKLMRLCPANPMMRQLT